MERSDPEAIKTDLLFGDGFQLELVAARIGQNHFKKPCRVSLLNMMKQHFTGEAEVSALVHTLKMRALRPARKSGSASIVRALMKHSLIDRYQLLVYPIVLGSGKRLFEESSQQVKLSLVSTERHPSGVVVLAYQPGKE